MSKWTELMDIALESVNDRIADLGKSFFEDTLGGTEAWNEHHEYYDPIADSTEELVRVCLDDFESEVIDFLDEVIEDCGYEDSMDAVDLFFYWKSDDMIEILADVVDKWY